MVDFNTTLLREKFVIRDVLIDSSQAESVIALSNRIVVPLMNLRGEALETFVVRGHNMHTTLRIAAKLVQSFEQGGRIMEEPDFDWDGLWRDVTEGYEKDYNPECWAVIYFEGKPIFVRGTHHSFLDVIEKFDVGHADEYEQTVKLAEKAFKDAGKPVSIEHDMNVAVVLSINPKQARCGIILRGSGKTTTFNFTAKEKKGQKIRTPQCMSVVAAFLEGLHLAFTVGMGKRKLHYDMLDNELERKKTFDGEKRLGRLTHAILNFDQIYQVNYRPERPDLFEHVADAENFADKILKAKIKSMQAAGILDNADWVG